MILPRNLDKYRNSELLPFHSHHHRYGKKTVFSNLYPSQFTINDVKFNCVEQWITYNKAIKFGDTHMANRVLSIDNPIIIKEYGKKILNFNQEIWNKIAFKIILQGCFAKFSQNNELKNILLATQNKLLIFVSLSDNILGIGLSISEFRIYPREEWGQNQLGIILMRIRELLNNDD